MFFLLRAARAASCCSHCLWFSKESPECLNMAQEDWIHILTVETISRTQRIWVTCINANGSLYVAGYQRSHQAWQEVPECWWERHSQRCRNESDVGCGHLVPLDRHHRRRRRYAAVYVFGDWIFLWDFYNHVTYRILLNMIYCRCWPGWSSPHETSFCTVSVCLLFVLSTVYEPSLWWYSHYTVFFGGWVAKNIWMQILYFVLMFWHANKTKPSFFKFPSRVWDVDLWPALLQHRYLWEPPQPTWLNVCEDIWLSGSVRLSSSLSPVLPCLLRVVPCVFSPPATLLYLHLSPPHPISILLFCDLVALLIDWLFG